MPKAKEKPLAIVLVEESFPPRGLPPLVSFGRIGAGPKVLWLPPEAD